MYLSQESIKVFKKSTTGNSTILNKMTEKAQQLVGNITKNGSEEKILKRHASNNFNSNLNV
jgi:hypothetical protein